MSFGQTRPEAQAPANFTLDASFTRPTQGNLSFAQEKCFMIQDGDCSPDTSIETGSVVSFNNVPAIDVTGTDSTIVGAL